MASGLEVNLSKSKFFPLILTLLFKETLPKLWLPKGDPPLKVFGSSYQFQTLTQEHMGTCYKHIARQGQEMDLQISKFGW